MINPTSVNTTIRLPRVVIEDCEVDGLNHRDDMGELVSPNITEVCVKMYDFFAKKTDYKIVYMKKPEDSANESPFRKKIPKNRKRQDTAINLEKVYNYIKNPDPNDKTFIIVFNKSWDERVLKENYERRGVTVDWKNIVFVDMAEIAHHMGFPHGTTQSRLASAYTLSEPQPADLHTSHADTRVLTLICRRVFQKAVEDLEQLNQAFYDSHPEKALADYLLTCDPTLAPSQRVLAAIQRVKDEKIAERLIEIGVGLDLETTGLEPYEASHHDKAVRPLQFAAQVIMPDGTFCEEDAFQSYINPGEGVEISPGAFNVHGISLEKIAGQPNVLQVWAKFIEHVNASKALKQCIANYRITHPEAVLDDQAIKYRLNITGYNTNHYDLEILKQELMHGNEEYDLFDLKQAMNHDTIGTFDVLHLAQTFFTEMKDKPANRKLTTVAEFYQIPTEGAHEASKDVSLTLQVLQKMCAGLNIATVINELSHIRRNPGLAAKEIIREAQKLIASQAQLNPDEAVKQAARDYKLKVLRESEEKLKEHSENNEKKRKLPQATNSRFKRAVSLETSQQQLVASYPYDEYQGIDPFISYK